MKKITVLFLSLIIAFAPAYALANTALGGWSITNRAMEGATRLYDGAKTAVINGSSVAKTSVARYAPTVADVAKGIGRTGAVLAVSVAIEQLIGAVDWVMDPANNRVRYFDPVDEDPLSPLYEYYWVSVYNPLTISNTASEAAQKMVNETCRVNNYKKCSITSLDYVNEDRYIVHYQTYYSDTATVPQDRTQNVNRRKNPVYDPSLEQPEQQEKYLSFEAIAGEIIGEAEGGDTRAGGYVGDVADWEVANTPAVGQNVAQQFEANAKTGEAAGSGTATGEIGGTTDPVTGEAAPPTDFALEFPRFCGWAPTVCEAAQTVITFPPRVQSWVTDLLGLGQRVEQEQKATTAELEKINEYITEDVNTNDSEEVEIEHREDFDFDVFSKNRFRVSQQCPVAETHTLNVNGVTVNFSFDLTPICTVLEFARPALVACSYLYAAYIVIGAARNG